MAELWRGRAHEDPANVAYDVLSEVVDRGPYPSNYGDWPSVIEPFRTTPPRVLIRAYARYDAENRVGDIATVRRQQTARRVVSRALEEFCGDDELASVLSALAATEPFLALTLATYIAAQGRGWHQDMSLITSIGAIPPAIYAALYFNPTRSALEYVTEQLGDDNAAPGQRDLAEALLADWHGSLDSLIETVRRLCRADQVLPRV